MILQNSRRRSKDFKADAWLIIMCLGAHLARLEAQEAILALLEKYPALGHSDKGFEYASIPSFRGMSYFYLDKTLIRRIADVRFE